MRDAPSDIFFSDVCEGKLRPELKGIETEALKEAAEASPARPRAPSW